MGESVGKWRDMRWLGTKLARERPNGGEDDLEHQELVMVHKIIGKTPWIGQTCGYEDITWKQHDIRRRLKETQFINYPQM